MKKLISTCLLWGTMLQANPFVIEKDVVEATLQERHLSINEYLQSLVPVAQEYARPPISNYKVGVVGLGKSGNIYLGANLELDGLPLLDAVHAEQFMLINARMHGEEELVAIALSAAPCGYCRQFLNETGNQDLVIITPFVETTLSALLPYSFGPQDLGLEGNLLAKVDLPPCILLYSPFVIAEQAAYASYAPYSGSKSGIALQTSDGSIFGGSYLENAAFNPSLSPLSSALVNLVMSGKDFSEIEHVVLVEDTSAKISQKQAVKGILKKIAPEATFEYRLINL